MHESSDIKEKDAYHPSIEPNKDTSYVAAKVSPTISGQYKFRHYLSLNNVLVVFGWSMVIFCVVIIALAISKPISTNTTQEDEKQQLIKEIVELKNAKQKLSKEVEDRTIALQHIEIENPEATNLRKKAENIQAILSSMNPNVHLEEEKIIDNRMKLKLVMEGFLDFLQYTKDIELATSSRHRATLIAQHVPFFKAEKFDIKVLTGNIWFDTSRLNDVLIISTKEHITSEATIKLFLDSYASIVADIFESIHDDAVKRIIDDSNTRILKFKLETYLR